VIRGAAGTAARLPPTQRIIKADRWERVLFLNL